MRRRAKVTGATIVGLLLATQLLDLTGATAASPTSGGWTAWRTSPYDAGVRLASVATTDRAATRNLVLDPTRTAQTWRGVGASLTDAATGILGADPDATDLLFDADRADGAHLNLVRLPLSATDFSTAAWAYGWDDATGTLTAPSAARAQVDLLTDAIVPLRPDLEVVAAPWSAPAAMKTSGALNGGALSDTALPAYGRMLTAQADWLRSQGVPLGAVTLANEPYHSTSSYPTMLVSDAQQAALATTVGPALAASGVQLWSVDHNWDHRSHYDAVQSAAPGMYAASAFHCYGGSPGQMAGVAAPPIITECTGTTDGYAGTFWWDSHKLVSDAIDAGSTGLMMWNLALDENHGPHIGGCSTCRGVVDVDGRTGAITRGPEFYTLAHLARAADPGAVVIGRQAITDTPYAAFQNPDGSLGIVGHNDTSTTQVVAVSVGDGEAGPRFEVGPGELFTLRGPAREVPPLPVVQVDGAPVVTGDARVGGTLSVSTGAWSPSAVTLDRQWLRSGVPVPGATGATYPVGPADLGAEISVRVTGSLPGWQEASITTPVATIGAGALSVVAGGRIVGRLAHGATLRVAGVQVTPSPTVGYQWLRDGRAIGSATGPRHRVTRSDRGHRLGVRLTLSAEGYADATVLLGRGGVVGRS